MYQITAVLAFLGIINTIYLINKTSGPEPLICPLGSDCNAVLHSKWSKTFGIKNDLMGLLYYVYVLGVALTLTYTNLFGPELKILLFVTSAGGVLFSIYLTYVQLAKLKNICFYCLISALITTLIFLISMSSFLLK